MLLIYDWFIAVDILGRERRPEVDNVIDSVGARGREPRTAVARRPGRALADRAVDTYANNPRLHSEADLEKIAASILKWGWTNPVLVDEKGVLIAGHGRVAAAAKLGLKSIPVIVAHGSERRGEAGLPFG